MREGDREAEAGQASGSCVWITEHMTMHENTETVKTEVWVAMCWLGPTDAKIDDCNIKIFKCDNQTSSQVVKSIDE